MKACKVEVFYTGGGIWLAELDLQNGTYAVIDSDYTSALCIYQYPEEGEEQYMPEDAVFCEDVKNLDLEQMKIYNKLCEALKEKALLD